MTALAVFLVFVTGAFAGSFLTLLFDVLLHRPEPAETWWTPNYRRDAAPRDYAPANIPAMKHFNIDDRSPSERGNTTEA